MECLLSYDVAGFWEMALPDPWNSASVQLKREEVARSLGFGLMALVVELWRRCRGFEALTNSRPSRLAAPGWLVASEIPGHRAATIPNLESKLQGLRPES